MALSTARYTDTAQVLASVLATVPGLRVHWYVADTARPPAVVIGQPEVDYAHPASGFCTATWTYPLTLLVARNQDRDAQQDLARFLADMVDAIKAAEPADVFDMTPLDARPITASVSGQDLPAYYLRVQVRA